jgi:hypothetical protein
MPKPRSGNLEDVMTEQTETQEAPKTEVVVEKKPFKAYAVVSTGNENLWDGFELECDPSTGTFKVLRQIVPNTRDIAMGRIFATIEGTDGCEYGPGPEAPAA